MNETTPPPSDIPSERALVAALMVQGDARTDVSAEITTTLSAEDFFSGAMGRCWEGIRDLAERNESCDSTTLATWLENRGRLTEVGGLVALARMLGEVTAAGMSEKALQGYARSVRDKANRRRLIKISNTALARAYASDMPTDELIAKVEEAVHELGQASARRSTVVTLKASIKASFTTLKEHQARGGGIMGMSTGFPELDQATGGLMPGDLTIIAARPGMGKTSLAMALAINLATLAAASALGVYFVSEEMPHEQLSLRAVASEGEVNLGSIRAGRMTPADWSRVTHAATKLSTIQHFYLDDDAAATLADISSRARRIQSEVERAGGKLGLIVVDYIQLVPGHGQNREQEVSGVSRGLKRLAKNLRVPVIALSQLNREVERRPDKRPTLADLRDSGAIEQDADNILFVYRDEYYDAESEKPGIAELCVAKQRNGPTGTVEVVFKKETATFRSQSVPGSDHHPHDDDNRYGH